MRLKIFGNEICEEMCIGSTVLIVILTIYGFIVFSKVPPVLPPLKSVAIETHSGTKNAEVGDLIRVTMSVKSESSIDERELRPGVYQVEGLIRSETANGLQLRGTQQYGPPDFYSCAEIEKTHEKFYVILYKPEELGYAAAKADLEGAILEKQVTENWNGDKKPASKEIEIDTSKAGYWTP